MKDLKKASRRRFLLHTGLLFGGSFAGAAAFAQGGKKAEPKKDGAKGTGAASGPGTDLPLVDEKAPLAVTLKYNHNGAKVPANVKVAKGGVDGAQQLCSNCMFYAKAGKNGSEEAGKCQLFPQGYVLAKGWCSSWTKKA